MLKSLIVFFRKRNVKRNLQQKNVLKFPELDNSTMMTILLDYNQKNDIKEIERLIKVNVNPKSLRFIVLCDSLPENIIQTDLMVLINKNDFNSFGVLKKEKDSMLKSMCNDLFINMSDKNERLLNDYLVSCVNSSFKIGHSNVNFTLHDFILDYGAVANVVERVEVLFSYLFMLSGKKQ